MIDPRDFQRLLQDMQSLRTDVDCMNPQFVDSLESRLAAFISDARVDAKERAVYRTMSSTLLVHVDVSVNWVVRPRGEDLKDKVKALLRRVVGMEGPGESIASVGRVFDEPHGFSSTLFVVQMEPNEAESIARSALQQILDLAVQERSLVRGYALKEVSWMDDSGNQPIIVP